MPPELKDLMLCAPRLTLAVVESMTCGWLQTRIGAIPGASEFFLGGITTYEINQKVRHLGVNRTHASEVNAVSQSVAEQMALGGCTLFKSDLTLSTTGYAEPCPALGVTEPFAFWALAQVRPGAGPTILQSGRIECTGANRVQAQQRVADAVLGELTKYLTSLRG